MFSTGCPCSYNAGQNVWDTLPFILHSCNNVLFLPLSPSLFPVPHPLLCWMTVQQDLSLQTTLHGREGEGKRWPKELLFPCEQKLMVEAWHSASVPHNFGHGCRYNFNAHTCSSLSILLSCRAKSGNVGRCCGWAFQQSNMHTYLHTRKAFKGEIFENPVKPFTPNSDQFKICPAASPEILHHTVWRTWLLIPYSNERWLHYQYYSQCLRMYFLNLGVKG